MRDKSCLYCQYIDWGVSTSDWSECTPGDDFHCGCLKDKWTLSIENDTLEQYRNYLLMAETCQDFKLRSDISKEAEDGME